MSFGYNERSFTPNPKILPAGTYLFPLIMHMDCYTHVVTQAMTLDEPMSIDGSDTDGIPLTVLAAAYFYSGNSTVDSNDAVGAHFESVPGVWLTPSDEIAPQKLDKSDSNLRRWAGQSNNDTVNGMMDLESVVNLARDYLALEEAA